MDRAHAENGTVHGPYADSMTNTAPLSLGLADAVLAMSSTLAATNFYLDDSDLEGDFLSTAAERRERLYEHLSAVYAGDLVLVGEAAGWQGARQSGVPFTSAATVGLRGNQEPSATAVHKLLASVGAVVTRSRLRAGGGSYRPAGDRRRQLLEHLARSRPPR